MRAKPLTRSSPSARTTLSHKGRVKRVRWSASATILVGVRGLRRNERAKPLTPPLSQRQREQAELASRASRNSRIANIKLNGCRELGELPLPAGERVGVRGLRRNERAKPLTPPLSQRHREQAELASRASRNSVIIAARSEQLGERAPVTGVDVDGDAHAGAQDRVLRLAVDADAHRDPLHDLDPIAARVLRRQDRELGAARRADALDRAAPNPARIAIDE